jgi:hypothetical protein
MNPTILVILHALSAVALIGALTHQALAVWWSARQPVHFVQRFRAVPPAVYANAIVVLYLITFALGGWLYPDYRLNIRVVLEQMELPMANGSFELKEHFAVMGLSMLPAYWYFWRAPADQSHARTRAFLTALLAFIVWWNFLVGHVLNNIRGFGA